MKVRDGIEIDDEVLDAFCRRHGIAKLSLFGSALGDAFRSGSDVDLLVEFQPGRTPGLFALSGMELELEALLGRQVDLRLAGDLSPYFRDEVRRTARPVYAAH